MSTNLYINNYQASNEQRLVEELISESIKMYGMDIWYIPRTIVAKDDIFNEDDLPLFDSAYMMESYIRNVDSFEGEGDILAKFGVTIRDSMTFTISQFRFEQEIELNTGLSRPNEGDLIYFPLNRKIWEIMHVEHEAIFYQMGALQTYDLKVELFEYSNERFTTGVAEIDDLFDDYDMTSNTAIANVETVSVWADNIQLENEADALLDFSEADPFSEGGTY